MIIFTIFLVFLTGFTSAVRENYQCGVKKVVPVGNIRHGKDTIPGEWPWQAAIFHRAKRTISFVCGGILISEYHVLTAAHCCVEGGHEINPNRILIKLGITDLIKPSNYIQSHQVHDVLIHEEFNQQNFMNDLGILTLATKAKLSDYVIPACLKPVRSAQKTINQLDGTLGTVLGWGLRIDNEVSDILQAVKIPIIDHIKCLDSNRDYFGQTISYKTFCGGYQNGTTVCPGDSGGGLFLYADDTWYIRGIISFSASTKNSACQTKDYAGFVNFSEFVDWVLAIIHPNEHNDSKITPTKPSFQNSRFWIREMSNWVVMGKPNDTKEIISSENEHLLNEIINSTKCQDIENDYWMKYIPGNNQSPPPNTVIVGIDGDLKYTCRVNHDNAQIPGKYSQYEGKCYFGYDNKELWETNSEIFVNHKSGKFVSADSRNIPENAFIAGQTKYGEPLYICRAASGKIPLTMGYASLSQGHCFLPWGGVENPVKDYEIYVNLLDQNVPKMFEGLAEGGYWIAKRGRELIIGRDNNPKEIAKIHDFDNFNSLLQTIDVNCPSEEPNYWTQFFPASDFDVLPNTVITGFEFDNKYSCRVFHEGNWIPGKYSQYEGYCFYGWEGKEYNKRDCQLFVHHEGEFVSVTKGKIPKNAFIAGKTKYDESMYICRAKLPGEIPLTMGMVQHAKGTCGIPFGGLEHKFHVFEIYVDRNI